MRISDWSSDVCSSDLGPRAQVGLMAIPEILRQRGRTGVEQAEIVQRAIVFVILGDYTNDCGLDAQIDVLGHQDDFAARMFFAQGKDRGQTLVVWQHRAKAMTALAFAVTGSNLDNHPAR